MRVIMFPAVGVQNENRYIDILVSALRAEGVVVENWTKHLSFQQGDVFHVHWPEIVAEIRDRKNNLLRGLWIEQQFFSTIRRVKKNGGRVVWTVHDLAPHDAKLRDSPFLKKFMQRFMAQVDVACSLTAAGIDQIKQTLPSLNHARFCVTHHPHYRTVLGEHTPASTAREKLGIQPAQRVYSFIGSLRPNKRPDLVTSAFRALPQADNFLIVAGGANSEMTAKITQAAQGQPNIRLDLRRIPEDEIGDLYAATDIMVFPGTDYFNSGTIYTALSLNVPVLAAWSPSNAELQQAVGNQWLYLYQGDFTADVLAEAGRTLIRRTADSRCNLDLFEPKACALEHIEAYSTPTTSCCEHNHAA